MKTLFYSILLSIICITFFPFNQLTAQDKKYLLLQANDTTVPSELLTQSAKVMNNRLITYGIKTNILVVENKAQICIELPDNINKFQFTKLLTSKGDLGFYGTLTTSEISEAGKKVNPDLKFEFPVTSSDSKIGCSASEDKKIFETISNYLKQFKLAGTTRLLWSQIDRNSQTCLFVLKTDEIGNPSLKRSDIESITSYKDKISQYFNIEIKFKTESAKIWAGLTKENLNKPIAIVIDTMVYYTPIVKTTIEKGLCEITGNLSEKEANYFIALVNNGTLPIKFTSK
jgi:SecD/SecF fusion protein